MPGPEENELALMIVGGIIALFILVSIVIYILFFYQRKRFEHRQQIIELQKQFNETLLQSQLEIQEHSFNIISQEIHDNVGQVLSLAKIQLNIIANSEDINRNMVLDVKENIVKVMTDLRDIAKGLNTDRIQIGNLYDIISLEVDRLNRSGIIKGTLTSEGIEQEITDQHRLILFRIVQESLQNILKHSKATSFSVQLTYYETELAVTISDDGSGFNTTETSQQGLGLGNIRSRASLMGGSAHITSQPGQGTAITIKLPYAI